MTAARHVVVMGVSGTGKSTVGRLLAERLGWAFVEGDDHHPPENVARMRAGTPLTDADRWGWLEALADLTRQRDEAGESTVLSCSALRRAYRDVLRRGGPTTYVHLVGDHDLLLERMGGRDHFMPPTLLDSQLETLEQLGEDEDGFALDVAATPERLVDEVVRRLSPPGS